MECEKDFAEENEKMDEFTECGMVKITNNELSFHEDEMRKNAKKLQCPLKIPGMLECENGAGGTTTKTKEIPVVLENDTGAGDNQTLSKCGICDNDTARCIVIIRNAKRNN